MANEFKRIKLDANNGLEEGQKDQHQLTQPLPENSIEAPSLIKVKGKFDLLFDWFENALFYVAFV